VARSLRSSALLVVALLVLFALHVQLNLGGWPRFLARLGPAAEQRAELVVGFLPVT
jgi:hypothetical protein